jgi:hypothetical protein
MPTDGSCKWIADGKSAQKARNLPGLCVSLCFERARLERLQKKGIQGFKVPEKHPSGAEEAAEKGQFNDRNG